MMKNRFAPASFPAARFDTLWFDLSFEAGHGKKRRAAEI
jgi:hypothetical protein